jgi:hypothetical protein
MFKSNLIEILTTFNQKEIKDFGDFVNSPYFNKNEGVINLFNYLKKYHGSFNEKNTEKETVFKNIFSGAEYNDVFMRSLIFKLNQLAEDYITLNDFAKNSTAYHIQQADSFLDRNLDGQAGRLIRQTISRLDSSKNRNEEYYYSLYKLEALKHIIYSRTYTPLTVKDKPDEGLIAESENLIKFFLIKVLQRYRYLLNKSTTVNIKFELDLLNEIMEYLSKDGKKFLSVSLINILSKQVQLMLNPDNEKMFYELKDILTDDNIMLDKGERRDGLTVLNNYSIDKFYRGKAEYREIMHSLNVYEIEHNLFNRVKGGYFEPAMFNNVVTIALSLKHNDWVLKFIEKYHSRLSPVERRNIYNFSFAKYHFYTREFERSLEFISKVTYSDIYNKFHGRIMLIALHYELNNFETLFSTAESFKKFIANDKLLTEQHKTTNSNFIKFAAALCRIKSGASNEDPGLVKKNISECGNLTYRKWLMDKADELIKLRK